MNHYKRLMPLNLYMVLTLGIGILWIIIPEIAHFAGASSMIYAFIFAVGSERGLTAYLAIAWIPFCMINLIVWYIYAVKSGKLIPFIVITGADLLVSICIICAKICANNDTDLGITLAGFISRTAYYFWMVQRIINPFSK